MNDETTMAFLMGVTMGLLYQSHADTDETEDVCRFE